MRYGRSLACTMLSNKLHVFLATCAIVVACGGGSTTRDGDASDATPGDAAACPGTAIDDSVAPDHTVHVKDTSTVPDTRGGNDQAEAIAPKDAVADLTVDTADKPEDVARGPDVEKVETCHSCHTPLNEIYSQLLGRNLAAIDWVAGDVHGANPAGNSSPDKGTLKAPYSAAAGAPFTLKCIDCHVAHGTAALPDNPFSLAAVVNGVTLAAAVKVNDNSNGAWTALCAACHTVSQTGPGYPCGAGGHGPGPDWTTRPCFDCHSHQTYICGPGNWSF